MSHGCYNYEPIDLPDPTGGSGAQGPQGNQGPQGFQGSGNIPFYTNLTPTPSTVGGVPAGTTFSLDTVQQVFDMLFYPYQSPAFTSFSISGQATTVEVGETISGTKTFTWGTSNSSNVVANTIQIRDVTNNSTLVTGSANDGTESLGVGTVQHTSPTSHQWSIQGTNTQSTNFSSTFIVNWRWRLYYGTSTNTTLTESQIESLAGSALTASALGTYSLASGGYKYLCWPSTFADPSAFKDTATNLNLAMCDSTDDASYSNVTSGGYNYALVSVTNTYGQAVNYKVFRSKNILSSNINIQVS